MSDPRFYNPDGKPITLTDEVEFEEFYRIFEKIARATYCRKCIELGEDCGRHAWN